MKQQFLLFAAFIMMSGLVMAQPGTTKNEPKMKSKDKVAKPEVKPAAPMEQPTVLPAAPTEVKVVEEKKGEVLWINETTHDFGKIAQGKPVTTEFVLKNTGKDSLKLEMVQAGCGCTTPVWKPGPYAANEEFKITVGYNAAAEGAFNKPVTITYANGQQKVIYITGTVFSTPSTPAPQNGTLEKVKN